MPMLFCFFVGSGMITQEIFQSSGYYVALGNLDEDVNVIF